ncbi:MAG: hypothetical protein KC561_17190, partial [Myxococcales bacterium]|nr:hypothetical protein [Myxococcales bacterium]
MLPRFCPPLIVIAFALLSGPSLASSQAAAGPEYDELLRQLHLQPTNTGEWCTETRVTRIGQNEFTTLERVPCDKDDEDESIAGLIAIIATAAVLAGWFLGWMWLGKQSRKRKLKKAFGGTLPAEIGGLQVRVVPK